MTRWWTLSIKQPHRSVRNTRLLVVHVFNKHIDHVQRPTFHTSAPCSLNLTFCLSNHSSPMFSVNWVQRGSDIYSKDTTFRHSFFILWLVICPYINHCPPQWEMGHIRMDISTNLWINKYVKENLTVWQHGFHKTISAGSPIELVTSITLGFDLAYSTGHGVPPVEWTSTPLSKIVAYFHNHFTMDLSCLAGLYCTVQGPELDKTLSSFISHRNLLNPYQYSEC